MRTDCDPIPDNNCVRKSNYSFTSYLSDKTLSSLTEKMSVFRHQVLTFSLLWFGYFVTYLLRKPLGVIKTDIAEDLGLSKAELGWCDTALVLPYAGLQILLPGITDRWDLYSGRKIIKGWSKIRVMVFLKID